jgi:HEPN domain-containing protein
VLRQAWADLEHAELSLREGDFEWSCFPCQQAAEKGLKQEAISYARSIPHFCQAQVCEQA